MADLYGVDSDSTMIIYWHSGLLPDDGRDLTASREQRALAVLLHESSILRSRWPGFFVNRFEGMSTFSPAMDSRCRELRLENSNTWEGLVLLLPVFDVASFSILIEELD